MSDVTQILQRAGHGDPQAAEELLPLVYEELHKLAAAKMAAEIPGQTLQPTALVHEAWLRIAGSGQGPWNGRAHFFGAAAEAMRRILIDNARRRQAQKHGGGVDRVNVDAVELAMPNHDNRLMAIDDVLDRFAAVDRVAAELVKLRCFVGLTMAEAAEMLDLPLRSAERSWTFARAWLRREIADAPD